MLILGYLAIATLLIGWELELRILMIFARPRALQRSEEIFLKGAQRILRIARCYWRVNIRLFNSTNLPSGCIILANHQNYFDILMLRAMFPAHTLRFITKQSLKYGFPAVSVLMRIQQHCYISRTQKRAAHDLRIIQKFMTTSVRNNMSVALFPEGTRSGALAPFHYAGVLMALKSQAPIIVTAIHNTYLIGTRLKRRTNVSAKVIDTIMPPHSIQNTRAITTAIHGSIATYLKQLS